MQIHVDFIVFCLFESHMQGVQVLAQFKVGGQGTFRSRVVALGVETNS